MSKKSANSIPEISFTKSWNESVQGCLNCGDKFKISYYSFRLPNGRACQDGKPTWTITAFVQFGKSLDAVQKQLQAVGDGAVMVQEFDIPADAEEVIVWFVNTDSTGVTYYDSNYGNNYCFRIESHDVEVIDSGVATSWPTPYSGFHLRVSALDVVESVVVSFRPTPNFAGDDFGYWSQSSLVRSVADDAGNTVWEAPQILIPYAATVLFVINYSINGQTFVNDNEGLGFCAK